MIGSLLAGAAIAVAVLMLVTWVVATVLEDVSIVDLIWGFGYVVVAWVVLFRLDTPGGRAWLMAALATVWGLRLSIHLTIRNFGEPEDYRYRQMREKAPKTFWWQSLVRVFGLQGLLMLIVSLPLVAGPAGTRPLGVLDFIGMAAWTVGIFFESVGDWQLVRFKADPANKGEVMDHGLWRYTRHPNYFGDFMVWWGLFLMAAGAGAWWTVISPIVMSFLLLKVSGVGMLEKTIGKRRPGYAEYVARTNAFFPGPPS